MADKESKKSKKINDNETENDISEALEDIMNNNEIDRFIELIKLSKQKNDHNVLDLNTSFIEQHENGVEMFLKTAIHLEPKNPKHHYNYALFLETQRAYEQAQYEFEMAIQLDMNNDSFHTDYANLLFLLEDYQAAERQFKAALGINPKNVHVLTNLGKLYHQNKQHNKAEKALKRAIEIDPKFPLSYINLLQIYEAQGENTKATSLWKRFRTIENKIMDFDELI